MKPRERERQLQKAMEALQRLVSDEQEQGRGAGNNAYLWTKAYDAAAADFETQKRNRPAST